METDEIGDLLHQEYASPPSDPNLHIQYFYIRVGKKFYSQQPHIPDLLKIVTKNPRWKRIESGWGDEIVIIKSELEHRNEREHEVIINEMICKPIHKIDPSTHILISRACLYKNSQTCKANDTGATTNEIQNIMDNVYGIKENPENTHIEYFYLFVQVKVGEERGIDAKEDINMAIRTLAFEQLKTLRGDWKSVWPHLTWGGTFFSLFPKASLARTEREREELLNGEVRLPLIRNLEAKLALAASTERGGVTPKLQVILTRACKYTPSNNP